MINSAIFEQVQFDHFFVGNNSAIRLSRIDYIYSSGTRKKV